MTKPKPAKPASPEVPADPPPQNSDEQSEGRSDDKHAVPEGSEVPPPSAEPMDTDKSDAPPAAS